MRGVDAATLLSYVEQPVPASMRPSAAVTTAVVVAG